MRTIALKRVTTVAAGIVMASAMLAAPSSAESASANGAAAPQTVAGCSYTTNPQTPYRTGYQVRSAAGYSWGCAGNWTFRTQLQRSRWYGWETMDSAQWTGDGGRVLGFNCAGQHEYRATLNFNNGNGYSGTHYSAVVTLGC